MAPMDSTSKDRVTLILVWVMAQECPGYSGGYALSECDANPSECDVDQEMVECEWF